MTERSWIIWSPPSSFAIMDERGHVCNLTLSPEPREEIRPVNNGDSLILTWDGTRRAKRNSALKDGPVRSECGDRLGYPKLVIVIFWCALCQLGLTTFFRSAAHVAPNTLFVCCTVVSTSERKLFCVIAILTFSFDRLSSHISHRPNIIIGP